MSKLWDIRRTVRALAEGIVGIRYQETASERQERFSVCSSNL
jgi:hypothetical protein